MGEKAPLVQKISVTTPNVAAGSTDSFAIGEAAFDREVTAISFIPDAAATGDNTNKRTYTVVNKGQNGSGTTVLGTLDLVTGNNLVAFDEKAFVLSAVEGALEVNAGDVLALVSTHAASGLADPGGTIQVTIERA